LIISLVLLRPLAFTYDESNDPDPGVEAKYYDDAKVMRVNIPREKPLSNAAIDDGFERSSHQPPDFRKKTAPGHTDGRWKFTWED